VAWVGRGVSHQKNRRKVAAVPIFGFAISLVIYNAAELILQPEISVINFILSIIIGFALLFVALVLEWKS
jgi:hypothetical protein